jgi:O-antigen ligase
MSRIALGLRPVPRAPSAILLGLVAAGLSASMLAAFGLADPRLERPTIMATAAAALIAVMIVVPLFPLLLTVVAVMPFADWQPPGSPLSISVLLTGILAIRVLTEHRTLRSLRSGWIVRWTGLPLLLAPSAFLGAGSLGARGQLFLSIASWFAIAVLCAHFADEHRWRAIRCVLLAELLLALAVGGLEIAAGHWLIPFPDPPQIQAEHFFQFFRPRAITLSPYALGEFLAFTAPLVWYELGIALRNDRLRCALWWCAVAAAQLALLVATLSRKSLWQLSVAAVVFFLLSLRNRKVRGRMLIVSAAVGALAVLAVVINGPALSERLTSSTSAESVATRVNTLQDAIDIGSEHVLLGAGLTNFVSTSTDRYGEQLSAQNSFAEAFADSGLLGLFVVLALIAVPLVAAARASMRVAPPSSVVVSAMAGLIALAVVESSIWRKSLAYSTGFCLALFLNSQERAAAGSRLRRAAAAFSRSTA